MKFTYYIVCTDDNFTIAKLAYFSTKEKAEAYLNKIENRRESKYLKASYNAIETANMHMDSSEQTGKKFTYLDWLDKYNDLLFYYGKDIYDRYFYIVSTSIDIDDEPNIDDLIQYRYYI